MIIADYQEMYIVSTFEYTSLQLGVSNFIDGLAGSLIGLESHE